LIPIYEESLASFKLRHTQQRRFKPCSETETSVRAIISRLIEAGVENRDSVLKEISESFGQTFASEMLKNNFEVDLATRHAMIATLPQETKRVLDQAAQNITSFAEASMKSFQPTHLIQPEFETGLNYAPVESVLCYVPGGRYPLPSTALMTALTAKVAGVKSIYLTCPKPTAEVLYAAHIADVKTVFCLGGAQAVAGFALGSTRLPAVDMIVGPGNQYVTEAKRQLNGIVGIDMLAGPSEVGIIADAEANPDWVALDLIAQAEHDPEARVYLWTTSLPLALEVQASLQKTLQTLALPSFIEDTLKQSEISIFETISDCVEAANTLAPEHLELLCSSPESLKPRLKHYGALFMGYYTTVPYGDYYAGPNHTLPTARSARFTGSLSPMTFLRAQTWLHADASATILPREVGYFAGLEGLIGHQAASLARLRL
jgi:histidinol dehydrogenase